MLETNRVTLAYLITGIIGSQKVQLRQVASKVVYPNKETSLVERFRRFLQNENIVVKREVIILGDGEFDGSQLVTWFGQQTTWRYVCRTANNILVRYQDQWLALTDLDLAEGEETFLTDIVFTQTGQVGPLNILVVWHKKEKEHWFFVTNFTDPKAAKKWYGKRFSIETLFSDVKGRGFNLDKTRIWKPERVNRLIFAVAIAYIFSIFLGVALIVRGPFEKLFRTDRFYHSLFQLGLTYLNHLLKSCLPIPELEPLPPPDSFEHIVLVG